MSVYEYERAAFGLGTNGAATDDGIILGPGVSVPPQPQEELLVFIDELKAQQGPFVYVDKNTLQGQKFVTWMSEYQPSFLEWFSKLALVRGAAQAASDAADWVAQLPGWVQSESIQVQKWLYDQYLMSTTRVESLLRQQGKVLSTTITPLETENFIAWWKAHDLPGAAALVASYSGGEAPDVLPATLELPKGLYDYWKATGGTQAPPKKLLGLQPTWWDWTLNNWFWLAGGAAVGVLGTRWYMKRRATAAGERETIYGPPPGMKENPYRRRNKTECEAMGCSWIKAHFRKRTGGGPRVRVTSHCSCPPGRKGVYYTPGKGYWKPGAEKNPRTREGWGADINIKAGNFTLHPIITAAQYQRLRALNMREAKKFRVSSEGESLGELHKSHGKRRWKALSYYGPTKYSDSRAALLTWLKTKAKEQAMEEVIEELALPGPTVAPNLTREVL